MADEPIHKFWGIGVNEWIALVPNELVIDSVGLWQVIPVLQEDFGLSGDELRSYSKLAIVGLLRAGAIPGKAGNWSEYVFRARDHEIEADMILDKWETMPELAGFEGLWFDLPEEKEST